MLVPRFLAVTSTPATTAPDESVTVPVIVARLACAAADGAARTTITVTKRHKAKNLALDMLPPANRESDSYHLQPALASVLLFAIACVARLRFLQPNLNHSHGTWSQVDPICVS